MKAKKEQALTVRCPSCGAKPRQKCELSTGQPRTNPHRDRRLVASDKQRISNSRLLLGGLEDALLC